MYKIVSLFSWLFLACTHLFLLFGLADRYSTNKHLFDRWSWYYAVFLLVLALSFCLWPYLIKKWWCYNQGPNFLSVSGGVFIFLIFFETLNIREWAHVHDGRFHPHLQTIYDQQPRNLPPAPDGFKSGPIRLDKEENEFRIVFLGGSTTLNVLLSNQQTFTQKLEHKIQGLITTKKIQVINAGNAWYTSQHSLINYHVRIKPLKPDIIVVQHAINDMCRSFSPQINEPYRVDYSHFPGPHYDIHSYVNQGVWDHSNLKYFCTKVLYNSLTVLPEINRVEGEWPWPSYYIFKTHLHDLASNVLRDNVSLIFATQGYSYLGADEEEFVTRPIFEALMKTKDKGPDLNEVIRAFDKFNDVTRRLSQEFSAPLVDLEKLLPKNSDYFQDDVHLTDKATSQVADLFLDTILQMIKK